MTPKKNAQPAKAELSAITVGTHSICLGSSTANRTPDGDRLMAGKE